ncbi:MAG: nuclear transport factor 2 family protein [Rhodospirillaceae bacterium]|jgi:ketosteroid isomerase-like protein|nr:nuclear transport factor 2 family protein [Rhodospirillaceae bacterium]MBT3628153.1 nuclear transport factor 2 family protein [Rhodospirillaceae bacterium]MBT4428220.1 nuclear transport factor 2 family protein [Rhodospirillaceae bacterium]MBT5039694.1 nuclear transport factor 2 family protein [Rhodospirillaceae bacterium]MBT5674882.1 nuclear transport factor 2 family protein [Rhodospirillaceae bacterium]
MSQDIEKRLKRMEDIEDIKQLIARYAKAADHNGDPKMMVACFTEDAVWNCKEVGGWSGRDAIVEGLRETSTVTLPWALHYMTQPIITVAADGQTAEGEYYLWELAKATQEDGSTEDTWIGGWYESQFRKENGTWLFNHIELFLKLMSGASQPQWETPIAPWQG